MKECRRATSKQAPRSKAHGSLRPRCSGSFTLWDLLGRARSLDPPRAFTNRLLRITAAETRDASTRGSGDADSGASTFDAFADFPQGSLGWLIFRSGV
jgi:hypothetical protein